MIYFRSTTRVKLVSMFIALLAATTTNASLLDCSKSLDLELASGGECIPVEATVSERQSPGLTEVISAPSTHTASAGFHVNQTRTTSAVPEAASLLVLVVILLAVALVRAKSYNTK